MPSQFCSPERLNNPDFRDQVLPKLASATGLLVVDEAHRISDWGHDFRPDYRRLRTMLADLAPGVPVLATTATANARVTADVAEQLGTGDHEGALVLRGPLERESLSLGVLRMPDAAHRLAWLADHIGDLPGSGIVYTLTVAAAEEVTAFLRQRGHRVAAYSGRTEDADRRAAEAALLGNDVKALVATSALGMGFDKPDLGFVVHLGSPTTSRSAAPDAVSTMRRWCCSPGPRTRPSGATSLRWPSPGRSRCGAPWRPWPPPTGRCPSPRSRPGWTCVDGQAVDVRHRAVHVGRPAAQGRAAGDARVRHDLDVPYGVPAPATRPVLLVDDFTETGWTVAVAARLLRQAGATAVFPLVLALQG